MSGAPSSTPLGAASLPALAVAPWRLSGTVIGAAITDPRLLEALGDQVAAAPYKQAPHAPVLYVKPRHTLAEASAPFTMPRGADVVEIAATVGLVIGRTACRVQAAAAGAHIAACMLVADLGVPLASWYRPAAPARALDGSCRLGAPVPGGTADAYALRIYVDGRLAQQVDTAPWRRTPARLLADVSEFMTLAPGDVLLVGLPFDAPHARAGQRVRVEGSGLGGFEFTLEGAR
ncbi:MAG: fumarylacetoacetate hydrolase family protein [Burkholderiales bacterium]|nr:fumarylacetoacetate hydrolase family protein [Burkholderiales bacterium]